jgi:hypothetical protein
MVTAVDPVELTPAVYLAGALFFLLYIFAGDAKDSCIGLGLVALGVPAYLVFRGKRRSEAQEG